MNLLAHLHLGNGLPPVQAAGNLAADYCREGGSPDYMGGVALHQAIDSFTDSHPAIREARALFDGPHRRFAGILCDLAFDHVLSYDWSKWMPDESLESFVETRLAAILQSKAQLPIKAAADIQLMYDSRRLLQYGEIAGIGAAIGRILVRRPALQALSGGEEVIARNRSRLAEVFGQFYPELLVHVRSAKAGNTSP